MTWKLPLLFAGLDVEVPVTPGLLDPHLVVRFPVFALPGGVLAPQLSQTQQTGSRRGGSCSWCLSSLVLLLFTTDLGFFP